MVRNVTTTPRVNLALTRTSLALAIQDSLGMARTATVSTVHTSLEVINTIEASNMFISRYLICELVAPRQFYRLACTLLHCKAGSYSLVLRKSIPSRILKCLSHDCMRIDNYSYFELLHVTLSYSM